MSKAQDGAAATARGGVAEATAAMHKTETLLCCFCEEPVGEGFLRRSRCTVLCKQCNVSRVTASRTFGTWPPPQFDSLGKQDKIDFWRATKCSNGKRLADTVVHSLSLVLVQSEASFETCGYQPLSYYKNLGYDADYIAHTCRDTKMHPDLGLCYKVVIEHSTKEERRWRINQELWKYAKEKKLESKKAQVAKRALREKEASFDFGEADKSEDGSESSDGDGSEDSDSSSSAPRKAGKGKAKSKKTKKGKANNKKADKEKSKRVSSKDIKKALAALKGKTK